MRTQRPGTIWRLVLHVIASGLIGGAIAVVAWILVGLLYGFAIGLTENNLAVSIAEKTFHGAINGVVWAPLGVLVGAAFAILRLLWVNTTNRGRLVRAYSVAAIIALVLWSMWSYSRHQDRETIRVRYLAFCAAIQNEEYQDAYTLMSPKYRKNHTLDEFREDENLQYGLFKSIEIAGCRLHPQHSIGIAGNRADIWPEKHSSFAGYSGPIYDLEQIEGEWYFTGESEWSVD